MKRKSLLLLIMAMLMSLFVVTAASAQEGKTDKAPQQEQPKTGEVTTSGMPNRIAAAADEVYMGSTIGGPTFDRAIGCGSTSGLGPVTYHTYTFTPATSGDYTVDSVQDYDGYVQIYEGTFDPASPATNCIASNDDGPGGIGTSFVGPIALTGGTDYIIVTSGFEAGDEGDFTNTIAGLTSAEYMASTTDGDTYDRAIGCGPTISGLGPVAYHAQEFNVDTTGVYNVASVQDYDGYIHVYQGSWDSADPVTNCIASNDDGSGGIGTSDIAGLGLDAGTTYYLVTSGFDADEYGDFTNTVSGPGTATFVVAAACEIGVGVWYADTAIINAEEEVDEWDCAFDSGGTLIIRVSDLGVAGDTMRAVVTVTDASGTTTYIQGFTSPDIGHFRIPVDGAGNVTIKTGYSDAPGGYPAEYWYQFGLRN